MSALGLNKVFLSTCSMHLPTTWPD